MAPLVCPHSALPGFGAALACSMLVLGCARTREPSLRDTPTDEPAVAPVPDARRDRPSASGTRSVDAAAASVDGAMDGALIPDARVPDARVPDARVPDARVPDARVPDAAIDAAAASAGGPSNGELNVEVLTKPSGESRYEPHNLLAIWVEDDQGSLLHVLLWAAGVRSAALAEYNDHIRQARERDASTPAIMGSLFNVPSAISNPDIVSSATLREHAVRTARWDMTIGPERTPAPDGPYVLWIESAEQLVGSVVTSIPFTAGPEPLSLELPETDEFGPIGVRYAPAPSE